MKVKINVFIIISVFLVGIIPFFINLPLRNKKFAEIEKNRELNSHYINLTNLLQQKRLDEAYNIAINLYNNNQDSYIICLFLGDLFKIQSKFGESEFFYRKSLELNNKKIITYIKLSELYRVSGHTENAKQVLEICRKISPLNPLIDDEYGEILFIEKKYKYAIYSWEKAYEFNKNPNILLKIAKTYKVIENIRHNIRIYPKLPLYYRLYKRTQRYKNYNILRPISYEDQIIKYLTNGGDMNLAKKVLKYE